MPTNIIRSANKVYTCGLSEGWIGKNSWSGLLIRERVTRERFSSESQKCSSSSSDDSRQALLEEYDQIHVEPCNQEVEFRKLAPVLQSSQYDCLLVSATPLIALLLQVSESKGFLDQIQLGNKQIDKIPIFYNANFVMEKGKQALSRFFLFEEKVFVLLHSIEKIKVTAQEIESRFLRYLCEGSELSLSNEVFRLQKLQQIRSEQQLIRSQERHGYKNSYMEGSAPSQSMSLFSIEHEVQETLQSAPPVITTDMETGARVLQRGRKVNWLAPMFTGLSIGINVFMIMSFVTKIVAETLVDHNWKRLLMLLLVPFLMSISQFLWDNLVSFLAQTCFPIKHLHENSLYYSGHASEPLPDDYPLPSFTIHMPCYKEGLYSVLAPSLKSANEAIKVCKNSDCMLISVLTQESFPFYRPIVRSEGLQILLFQKMD